MIRLKKTSGVREGGRFGVRGLAATALCALFCAMAGRTQAVADRDSPTWYLKVNAAASDVKTTKSGRSTLSGLSCCSGSSATSGGSYSKTVTSTLRWTAEVRLRGKARPMSVEVRAFYIGCSGKGPQRIMKQETLPVQLDGTGKGTLPLVAPTVSQTKTRQQLSSGNSSSFRRSSSSVQGDRMTGCVVQLVVDGKVVRTYSSVPTLAKVAWDDPFTQESLVRKPKNALR